MNTDSQSTLPDSFPWPEDVKIRTRKLGQNPFTPFVPAPTDEGRGDPAHPRPPFTLRWEDVQQGLSVLVRGQENGHLMAEAYSTDAGRLDKAWVSVSLTGPLGEYPICKTVALSVPEKTGCSGSADLGPFTSAVKELGPQLGLIVFLMVP